MKRIHLLPIALLCFAQVAGTFSGGSLAGGNFGVPQLAPFARTQGLQTSTAELDRFIALSGSAPYSTDLASLIGHADTARDTWAYTITAGAWEDNAGGDCVPVGQTQSGVEYQLNEAASAIWAMALAGYLDSDDTQFAAARTRILQFAATTGFEIADLSGGNQCILDLGSAAYHIFEAAWLLESAGYAPWTATDKTTLANWAATQVFPLVSWGVESRKNNWGIVTYGSALAATAYVEGRIPVLTLHDASTITPAAYLSDTTRLTAWLSDSPGDEMDSACDPTYVFGLQTYGAFPDDLRRPSGVAHADCAVTSIGAHSTDGGCSSSTSCDQNGGHFYSQKSTNNLARVCEIMRRYDGDGARCFDLTSHGGDQEALRDAAQFSTGAATYDTWLIQDTTHGFRYVAGEYYADADLLSALDDGDVSVRGGHDYAYTRITHAPGVAYPTVYQWSWAGLTGYESRIPLLAAHDWSNAVDTLVEVEADWGIAKTTVMATDCDQAAAGSDQDRAVIQAALASNKVIEWLEEDSGGPQSPCHYDFATPVGGNYNRLAMFGQSRETTVFNHTIQPAGPTGACPQAWQLGTETGLSAGSAIAYTGSLAQGTTTITAASGTWAVDDTVVIKSVDADSQDVQFTTFLIAGTTGTTLVLNDPVPYAYSTGTVQKLSKNYDLVMGKMKFDTPYAWRGTCAQPSNLDQGKMIYIPNRTRTVLTDFDIATSAHQAVSARYSNNTVIKHGFLPEMLSLSRKGTGNGFVNSNGVGESGSDRIYDLHFRQGGGRLYGKPSAAGNSWYGFISWSDDQTMIGDPVAGYMNAGFLVHDTGTFYAGSLVTDDAVFPVTSGAGNSERIWFYHDCGDVNSNNAAPNVWEVSEVVGNILADADCTAAENARYHTFFRLLGTQTAADLAINAGSAVLVHANWIFNKLDDRNMTTAAKTNALSLYNLSASRDSNAGAGADYVSIGDETGSSTLSSCGSRNMPPSVVLRQDEPPCSTWCAEYGDASDNYGWNNEFQYGACSSTNFDLPQERKFKGLPCTPPPTCVDY